MKIKALSPNFIIISLLMFGGAFLSSLSIVSASVTNGTIDPSASYAWGENTGWVNFGTIQGDVHILDSGLTGLAWGENVGWIDLSNVTNDGEGGLSGFAWGENTGWIYFGNVVIGPDGVFSGSAWGENIGWIVFGTGNNKVATDWRPASVRGTPAMLSVPLVGTTIRTTSLSAQIQNLINNGDIAGARTLIQQQLASLMVQLISLLQAELTKAKDR